MIFLLLVMLCALVDYSNANEELCEHLLCNNTYHDGQVENYCNSDDCISCQMNGKCCISNETIIGLDLRFCGIQRVNISGSNVSDIIVLDLEHNEFVKFTKNDLIGLTKLDFLYLPEHIKCPGGQKAWNLTSYDHNMTSCSTQQNPCTYLNISCTDNGICEHIGPGSAKCVCIPGHYGYKCMNEGEFPLATFLTTVIVPTVVLSIALWFVQGRDAYRKS